MSGRLRGLVERIKTAPLLAYPLLLGGVIVVVLCWRPIVAGDTDPWYHLTGGRYILQHGALPVESFFSFLTPPRAFVDYYWLFQVLAYSLHRWTGYEGLIVFRALMFAITFGLIVRFLLARWRPDTVAWLVGISACYALILLSRSLIRPHLFTYLFIVLFLVLIERAPRRVAWLPAFAILWANFHGIAYPVMLVICGAYCAEYLLRRFSGTGYDPAEERAYFVPLVISMLAIFVTPHGVELLGIPFRPLGFLSRSVGELLPFTFSDFFSIQIVNLTPSLQMTFSLLLLAGCLAVMQGLATRSLRLSHAILVVAAGALISQGRRFGWESALLMLPVLAAHPVPLPPVSGALKWGKVLVGGLLMIMPLMHLRAYVVRRPAYPVSLARLPEGPIRFLEHVHARGKILNHPNKGGYLQWRLYPRYQIFMDMQGMFFSDEDLLLAFDMFRDKHIFQRLLAQHDPAFLMVPLSFSEFGGLIKQFPEYVLVFFDDWEALYVNQRQYPGIARDYALADLDPFQLITTRLDLLTGQEPWLAHLARLWAIHPDGRLVNTVAAVLSNNEQRYDQALQFTERNIQAFPELSEGYRLKADALRQLGAHDLALVAYRRALARDQSRKTYQGMAQSYMARGQYRHAYAAFKKAHDVFSAHVTLEELYELGRSALLAGKRREAESILWYTYKYRIPADQTDWLKTFKNELNQLGIDTDQPLQEARRTNRRE